MHSESKQPCQPMAPGVFTTAGPDRDAVLLGGRCPECGRNYFPRPPRCPHCLGPVKEKDLGSTGRLYTYTVVRVKPPWGLPKPYGLGYVDLDQGNLRVLGLLAPHALPDLKIGMRLRLTVAELGNNLKGEPCLRPYFEPAETTAARGEANV